MVDYRIAEDIGNGQYSAHNYSKGRKYVILFEKLPIESGAMNFNFDEFKCLCEDFLKKYSNWGKISELCCGGIKIDGDFHKQWFLSEILKIIDPEQHEKMKEEYDMGITP